VDIARQNNHYLGGFLVQELLILGRQNKHSSGGVLVQELVILDILTITPVDSSSKSWNSQMEFLKKNRYQKSCDTVPLQ
jgi:hypothetical protein